MYLIEQSKYNLYFIIINKIQMGVMKKIMKKLKKYLCCGGRNKKEVNQIYNEISQTDNII